MLSRFRKISSGAFALALMTVLCVPSFAFAGESTFTVEGDVTVALQTSQAASATKAAASTATNLAKTSDAVWWLVAGVVALGVGAILAMRASRRIAGGAAGAQATIVASRKGILSVILACVMAAVLCFSQFAAGSAYAAANVAGVACNGKIVVDENGKIVSNSFTISNGSTGAIGVSAIQAPESLSEWSASAPEAAIEAAGQYDGTWSTKDLSSDMLKALKDNNGELTLQMAVTCAATTYTVSFDTSGVDCAVESQTVQENATAVQPASPASSDYEFVGWYTDKDCTKAFDFATPITSDVTLYAKWTVKGYWLAAAGAEDPTANVVKTMSQVDADVAAIKSGDASVISEYGKYLSDDSVHLYARWNGSTLDASEKEQAANKYAEFRVIQVGNHDNEGCNITFQTTHLLPDSYAMNSTDTNTGGWGATELYASMQQGGSIYKSFDSEFTDKILAVSKASSEGDMSHNKVYSDNKFWILCYSELSGAGKGDLAEFEGSQYEYWKEQGVNYVDTYFKCLGLMTRAGDKPANLEGGLLRWWERSPLLSSSWAGSFTEVMIPKGSGAPAAGTTASNKLGISLAFCF